MHVLMMLTTVALAGTLGWLAVRMWRDVAPIVARVLAREEAVVTSGPVPACRGSPGRRSGQEPADEPASPRRRLTLA